MSTAATIRFEYAGGAFFVCRGHDGYPDVVLPDLEAAIELHSSRVSYPEAGLLVSTFLGLTWPKREPELLSGRQSLLPDYEVTERFRGDESYAFRVFWNEGCWNIRQTKISSDE